MFSTRTKWQVASESDHRGPSLSTRYSSLNVGSSASGATPPENIELATRPRRQNSVPRNGETIFAVTSTPR